ncbi:MAG: hypothetical protein AAFQ91_27245, partial [Cyanobacteria bacterium J06621_15]
MKGKFITLIGAALTLALSSTVAVAQSTKFPNRDFPEREEPTSVSESDDGIVAAAEEELSPDAMEILCVRFPLNSRCQGANAATPSPEDTEAEEIAPLEDNTSPDNTIETTPEEPLPGTAPEGITPAPDAPLPGTVPEGVTPAPDAPLPGTTPEGVTPVPGTVPGGEVTPSGDDAPTNITPIPGGVTPEAAPSEDDAPTNITPIPGGVTPEAAPSEDDA